MKSDTAIKVNNISKSYPLRIAAIDVKGNATNNHWALKDISFEIKKGESVGIIGVNGSGKSTLLQILAGTTKPTSGNVQIQGKVASILDIGAGFHPELSGKENIYLNGQVHGFTRNEITAKFDAIVSFSEIGKFIDEPVKSYSNGMYLRLAFSIMAHLDFDVYLLDEVMSVGDVGFAIKSKEKIKNLITQGKTLIVVSHNLHEMQDQNKFIQLENGKIADISTQKDILTKYTEKSISINNTIYTSNITITDFSKYTQSNDFKLRKVQLLQDGDKFVSNKVFTLNIELEKMYDNGIFDLIVLIGDAQGNTLVTTSPLLNGIRGNKKSGVISYTCQSPNKIFSFQVYRISLVFVQYSSEIFNHNSLLLSDTNSQQIISQKYLFDNIILFKPILVSANNSINAEMYEFNTGLMIDFDWKIDQLTYIDSKN